MLDEVVKNVRSGEGAALPSVCSAHADVIAASMLLAEALDQPLLIEATSNQVNHLGGYTGMTPAEFVESVQRQAKSLGCDPARLLLGGDHLGPQVWKTGPADAAMAEAEAMIAAYAKAGFTKLHLDCSEGCAGEPAQVGDGLASDRAARLALVAEANAPAPEALRYVIGTEVPPPGGARSDETGVTPTSPESAARTLEAHRKAFEAAGAMAAFDKVRALVVQPGLEFGPDHVDRFDIAAPDPLSAVLQPYPKLCFEAHSTDYQEPEVFPALARRGFGVLKVGPALTFAWREAVYALHHIAAWLGHESGLPALMSTLMEEHPGAWRGHYPQDAPLLRHFGLADRIRYYWAMPEAEAAVAALLAFLADKSAPSGLVAQYVPPATLARSADLGGDWARALLLAHVQEALLPYFGGRPC
ncbi:MAG: class II D-tagatose-bisphosphate aldolase, non-catalytic subunit [Paracoccaceae bacterium]|nr:class II D-tagatose-bisphosphate aldolase, non-catalytic subunit [Paracoccaceae bacterium]